MPVFTLLPGVCAALPCVCGGCVIILPQQPRNIFLGLNLTFVLDQFLTPCSNSCSWEQLPERVSHFTRLWRWNWETQSGSSTFLQEFAQPQGICGCMPWNTAASRDLSLSLTEEPEGNRLCRISCFSGIFPYFPSTHSQTQTTFAVPCPLPAKVQLQTGRCETAGLHSGQSSSWWLQELLVPSALAFTKLLPSPLPKNAQVILSSVLEVSSLPYSALLSWQHPNHREVSRLPKYLGSQRWCFWPPLSPWHGERIVGRSLGGSCQLETCHRQRRQRAGNWLIVSKQK